MPLLSFFKKKKAHINATPEIMAIAILHASYECADGFLKRSASIGIIDILEAKTHSMVVLHTSAFLVNKTVQDKFVTLVNGHVQKLLAQSFKESDYSDKFIHSILQVQNGILCDMIIHSVNFEDDDSESDFNCNPVYRESKQLLLHILEKEPDLYQITNVSAFIAEWLPDVLKYMSRFSIPDDFKLSDASVKEAT